MLVIPKEYNESLFDSERMLLSMDNHFRYSLIIPSEDMDFTQYFFMHHFAKRDAKNGPSYWKPRYEHSDKGTKINFSLRELVETFYGTYSSEKFTQFLEQRVEMTSEAKNCIEEFKQADLFYDYAFIVRFQSGRGQWEYFRVMAPGYTTDEIKEMIPKKFLSKSKYSRETIDGYSPLLKMVIKSDFLSEMQLRTGYRPTEEEYFLTKIASGRDTCAIKGYDTFLSEKNVYNADRLYFRFMKRWKKPLILFDNTTELSTVYLDQHKLQHGYVQTIYPVFNESYPIPDGEIVMQKMNYKGSVAGLFEDIVELSESILSGALEFRDSNEYLYNGPYGRTGSKRR